MEKNMTSFTDQAVRLAKQIEGRLIELRLHNADFTKLLVEATRMVEDASIEGLHLVHPQVVFQGETSVSLRVMLMNGGPLPIATAWIPVPKNWMSGNRQ